MRMSTDQRSAPCDDRPPIVNCAWTHVELQALAQVAGEVLAFACHRPFDEGDHIVHELGVGHEVLVVALHDPLLPAGPCRPAVHAMQVSATSEEHVGFIRP